MSQTINLNMIPQRNVRNMYFSQNDVGRVATVNLVDGETPYSIPSGATVKIQATKPSGLGFSESCTFSGSTVTVTSTATMTDEAGIFPCEIQVSKNGVILGTANFMFNVERNPHPDGTTDGTTESVINEVTIAIQNALQTAIDDLADETTAQKALVVAEGSAQISNVEDKGEEVIASIPLDYTELADAVANLPFTDVTAESEMIDTSALYRKSGYIYYYDNVNNIWKQVGSGSSVSWTLPVLYLNGDTSAMSKNTAVTLQYTYVDENNKYQRTGWLKSKWQGESSLNYPKKNFNFTFYHDASASRKDKIEFMDDCKESKWTAKANWIDHSAARNIFSAKLWTDIVKSRHTAVPTLLANSPRYGAIDGYPFMCYINGEFQGLYTMNIKKDDFTFGMDEDNPLHCAICGDINNDGDTTKNLSPEFRLASTTGWEVEVPSAFTMDTSTGLINLINFVMTSTDADFKTGLNTYLDVESAIDYYIFVYFIGAFDNLARNLILLTYDGGAKWYCSAYDLDSTFGLKAYGQLTFPSNGRFQEDYAETNSLLWQRLAANFGDEIYARYQELRSSVLNVSYMYRELEWFMNSIPEDDYLADVEKWPTMPNPRVDHLEQIETFISERAVYVDRKMAGGATIVNIDSVDLSDSSLSFIENVETGLNQTYFTEKTIEFTQYKIIDTSTGAVATAASGNAYATVEEIPIGLNSSVAVNPDKAKLFDNIVLYAENNSVSGSFSVWHSQYSPQGATTENHTNNSSFMFPLGKIAVTDVAGVRIQCSVAQSTEDVLNKVMVASLKGWISVDASDVPSGTGDVRTSALVPVDEGDIVFIRSINGTGDTGAYYTAVLQFADQSTSASSATATDDTNEPIKWSTVQSGKTYVGFKIARNLYNNGGHLEYLVISGGESNIITENSLGWDDQTVTASITPANATIASVVWASSDTSVATVTPSAQNQYVANITAHATGTATITCTVTDTDGTAVTAYTTVTVE